MTASALPQLQAAIYTALTGSARVMALVSAVYDAVPQMPLYPCVVTGDVIELSDRTMGQNGHEAIATLYIYTRDGSATRAGTGTKGFTQGLAIAEEIRLVLLALTSSAIADHTLVMVEADTMETTREADGTTRSIALTYSFSLEDA